MENQFQHHNMICLYCTQKVFSFLYGRVPYIRKNRKQKKGEIESLEQTLIISINCEKLNFHPYISLTSE